MRTKKKMTRGKNLMVKEMMVRSMRKCQKRWWAWKNKFHWFGERTAPSACVVSSNVCGLPSSPCASTHWAAFSFLAVWPPSAPELLRIPLGGQRPTILIKKIEMWLFSSIEIILTTINIINIWNWNFTSSSGTGQFAGFAGVSVLAHLSYKISPLSRSSCSFWK